MSLTAQFESISQALLGYRDLWSPSPFKSLHPSWVEQYPALRAFVLRLSDEQVEVYSTDINLFVNAVSSIFPAAQQLLELAKIPAIAKTEVSAIDLRFFKAGIKQRKWEQIQAFESCIPWLQQPLTEWCSGKGYLAQLYGLRHQQPVHCVEYDSAICKSGIAHASKFSIDAQFHQADVVKDNTDKLFEDPTSFVALHACGQLHLNLIEQVINHSIKHVAIAPCCYHLLPTVRYSPLSTPGKQTGLILTKEEMRLALEEHVTGTSAELSKHRQLQHYRLAFDEYCKASLNTNDYTPTPALAQSWAKVPVGQLMQHLAELKQMEIPASIDWQPWLDIGHVRYQNYRRYSLPRYMFRRLIELWLVLDRAIVLQENGYNIDLGEFCEKSMTPRNLMIIGQKPN
jgi:hypothetical protein